MGGVLFEVEETDSSRAHSWAPSHTNSLNLVLDVSMRNLWVGTQKQAVGRATGSPTELDQYHDSPDLAHRLLLLLKPTKFAVIMGIPVGRWSRSPQASLHLPLHRAHISQHLCSFEAPVSGQVTMNCQRSSKRSLLKMQLSQSYHRTEYAELEGTPLFEVNWHFLYFTLFFIL